MADNKWKISLSAIISRRMVVCIFIGFSSGLPLALAGQAMQAWLTTDGLDLATIGFLGLVGLPYSMKFLWAPLMDRFEPPWLGRRRGWMVVTQLALAVVLLLMSGVSPQMNLKMFSILALAVAFFSASQDIVIDAYRTDLLTNEEERGLGASLHVLGYRLAMIVSGGLAFVWAEQWNGWPQVYRFMALLMVFMAVGSFTLAPKVNSAFKAVVSRWKFELLGFIAMIIAVVVGYFLAKNALIIGGLNPDDKNKWIQLLFVIAEIGVALPLAWFAAKLAKFETLNKSLSSYFAKSGAISFLVLIILYKLGDAFAGSLTTPFLIKGVGFTQAEVGIANKIIGLWLTILGAFVGGIIMLRLKLFRSLLIFGVLQLVSNGGFLALALYGKGAWGAVTVPAFDWILISLKEPASLDWLLLTVIGGENITGGMGTAAFVGLLMSLCSRQFTATHYALLSAFAVVGRIYVSPLSGVLSESIGWPWFFIYSIIVAVPGVLMVAIMRGPILALSESEPPKSDPEDGMGRAKVEVKPG